MQFVVRRATNSVSSCDGVYVTDEENMGQNAYGAGKKYNSNWAPYLMKKNIAKTEKNHLAENWSTNFWRHLWYRFRVQSIVCIAPALKFKLNFFPTEIQDVL